MADESHVLPLAPAQIYRRSDEEWAGGKNPKDLHFPSQSKQRRRSSKCFVCFFTLVVLLSLASLVFALVVLRIKPPQLKLEWVHVQNLSYNRGGAADNLASLNSTLAAEMRISNDNFGKFEFEEGSASFLYGNATLGMSNVVVGGGLVRGRKVDGINVTVEARSGDDLSRNNNFSSDLGSNLVKLNGFANLRGRVRVVKIVTKHTTSFMNCSMTLNLTSQAIQDLRCC